MQTAKRAYLLIPLFLSFLVFSEITKTRKMSDVSSVKDGHSDLETETFIKISVKTPKGTDRFMTESDSSKDTLSKLNDPEK